MIRTTSEIINISGHHPMIVDILFFLRYFLFVSLLFSLRTGGDSVPGMKVGVDYGIGT